MQVQCMTVEVKGRCEVVLALEFVLCVLAVEHCSRRVTALSLSLKKIEPRGIDKYQTKENVLLC